MNSKELNERLALVGNIGVIIGLGVLIYEVNQSNTLAEIQAQALRLDQIQTAQTTFGESPYLPEIEYKLETTGLDSLTPIERTRLTRWEISVMRRMESHYLHYEMGYLDLETAQSVLTAAANRLGLWRQLELFFPNKRFEKAIEEHARAMELTTP